MSHVVAIDKEINDLDALKRACPDLGLEFREGQKTYKWYDQHVGDYPLPVGFSAEDLGKCEHAIVVTDANHNTYEVGVVRRRDGKPGYTLLFDFWNGGFGLIEKIGKDAGRLLKEYSAEVSIKELKRMGRSVVKSYNEDGDVVLRARVRA